MNNDILKLEPQGIWKNFSNLNAVPRASKKETQVIAFIKQFGTALNLPTYEDEVGNLIIKKPSSAGMENKQTIVLQSHLDMVHQKNNDTVFDFATEGIKMYIDGDWVKAQGTTLGADNGLGVATIMHILESTNVAHPAIEALFTIDEETGMTGALALKGGLLDGKIMLNLDTEEDDELTIGCAGGIDVTGTSIYNTMPTPQHCTSYKITLKGLTGGHSGIDIHKGRGNANKLLNRFLWQAQQQFEFYLSSFDGGSLRNAIPREAVATLAIAKDNEQDFKNSIATFNAIYKSEYHFTDPNLELIIEPIDTLANVMQATQALFFNIVYSLPHGIYRMDSNIAGLVQTSNNVSRILLKDGNISIQCLTRSSVDSEKKDLAKMIEAIFSMLGATTTFGGTYPGWAPKPDSTIVTLMKNVYAQLFNAEPKVAACHAGLECGILGTNYPDMQMISFGPTIHGAHSPDEKAQISSVQKFWHYLQETMKGIPDVA
jgi:dipeptidase D